MSLEQRTYLALQLQVLYDQALVVVDVLVKVWVAGIGVGTGGGAALCTGLADGADFFLLLVLEEVVSDQAWMLVAEVEEEHVVEVYD